MLKRTLVFTNPAYLSTKQNQLLISLQPSGQEHTVPIEDIAVVILENQQITITLPALQQLNSNNVAVICCNQKHMPESMLLNLDGHHLQSEVFRQQLDSTQPLKKQLWQQTIQSKIKNQAALLTLKGKPTGNLNALAASVKSDDASNREGTAAREYWSLLMGSSFTRDRYGDNPNPLLNYGYIVLRAAVTRALVGVITSYSIHYTKLYEKILNLIH